MFEIGCMLAELLTRSVGRIYWVGLLGRFIGPDWWSLTSSSPGSAFCADHRANVVTAVRKVDGWCASNGAPPETHSSVALLSILTAISTALLTLSQLVIVWRAHKAMRRRMIPR